jgi:hypothetical protein
MAAAFALAINSGNKIFYSQIEKICGFFRFAFSREGPSRETASAAAGSLRERPRSRAARIKMQFTIPAFWVKVRLERSAFA